MMALPYILTPNKMLETATQTTASITPNKNREGGSTKFDSCPGGRGRAGTRFWGFKGFDMVFGSAERNVGVVRLEHKSPSNT